MSTEVKVKSVAPYYDNQFLGPIYGYDFHTYYFQSYEPSCVQARQLRDKLLKDFEQEISDGQMRVKRLWDGPIGPHPYAMWESEVKNPEVFARLTQWYSLNHGDLSVLIHPHTGDEHFDHTQCGLWLGDKVKIITGKLNTPVSAADGFYPHLVKN